MNVGALKTRLAQKRDTFVQEWLACTLRTYPTNTSHFLRQERDPFRNPVGHTLREGLSRLVDELLGEFDPARVMAALDGIVRMRAVQDFSPSGAVEFVVLGKAAARTALAGGHGPEGDELAALDAQIDQVAGLASALYATCCEQIAAIRTREARRRIYLLERMRERRTREETGRLGEAARSSGSAS
jgi:hypothetical protein